MKHLGTMVLLLFVTASVMAHGQTSFAPSEQLHFSAEDAAVRKPILIPQAALAILRKDNGVRDALQSAKLPGRRLPSEWFSVSEIHLGPASERDFVVVGEGPLLSANMTTYWVFVQAGTGLELALKSTAHDFTANNTRTKAHRNIEIATAPAAQVTTTTFHFDGNRYHTYARGTRKTQ